MTGTPLGGVGPAMACDVCGVRLNSYEQWDGNGHLEKISWGHMLLPAGIPDHEPVPYPLDDNAIPRVGFCDFCIADNPVWSYPTRPFQVPLLWQKETGRGTDTLGWGSADNWGACHDCRNDIEALKWDSIERRYFRNKPVPKIPGYKAALRGDIRVLHREFRLHRIGPPFLVRGSKDAKND